jgi:hypothetical protein
MVDARGKVGIGFVNVGKMDETSMREVRNLDRSLGTEVTMQELNYTNRNTQTNVKQMGAKVSFDALKLLDAYIDSEWWRCNAIVAIILLTFGGLCIYYVLRNISSYL